MRPLAVLTAVAALALAGATAAAGATSTGSVPATATATATGNTCPNPALASNATGWSPVFGATTSGGGRVTISGHVSST